MKSKQQIALYNKRKRKKIITIILIASFVLSVTAAVLLSIFLPNTQNEQTENPKPDIIEGLESEYMGEALAYPTMQESQIKRITIKGTSTKGNKTEYTLARANDGKGSFVLEYVDENGEKQIYYPDIVDADSSFDYESLYAIEQGDGVNRIPKLTYLCVAIEYPYFDERMPLEAEESERAAQLKRFGLDDPQILRFDYTADDEITYTRYVKIGDINPTGLGYYYMVTEAMVSSELKADTVIEYREYIYNSTTNHYNYAFLGFESYVHSMLVAAGLAEDSSYEPYLTPNFKHWVNQTYKEEGTQVKENSNVIVYRNMLIPLESALDSELNEESKDGYAEEYDLVEIDLSEIKSVKGYESLIAALSKAKIGTLYDSEQGIGSELDQITVTLTANPKTLSLGEKESTKYKYTVTAIESILTDSEDILTGKTVSENDKIRITYTLSVDGTDMTFKSVDEENPIVSILYHAVLDLSEAALPDEVRELVGKSIGELESPVVFEMEYSEENSAHIDIKCKIVEIISVYNKNGAATEKIAEDSIVTYRYCYVIDGVEGELQTGAINLGTDETQNGAALKAKLVGRKASKNLNIIAYEYTAHCEYLKDFMVYEIADIVSFVTSEMISAFRFQNSSERDPFYGESIYENILENKYKIYGLNSGVCDQVIKILGGIGDTTGSSQGLVGSETVAVGLTPEIKEKYGLYAHTIFFELPRGIIVRDSGNEEEIDDYTWYETLGFTLYISEVDPLTNMRHVGSDLYDVVATVDASSFVFLEYDFVNFWARMNLMLVDIEYIDYFNVEFSMNDIVGGYKLSLNHRDYYIENGTGKPATQSYNGETYDFIKVDATSLCKCDGECVCTKTKLLEAINSSARTDKDGNKAYYLSDLYDLYLGATEGYTGYVGTDTYGTSYFKELIEMLFFTHYEGTLTEQEQQEALDSAPLVMRFEIKLRQTYTRFDKPTNASADVYVYEFYRCQNGRVMVSIYQVNSDGNIVNEPVTDFYISNLAFKKIVSNFRSLFNAEEFDPDQAYPS